MMIASVLSRCFAVRAMMDQSRRGRRSCCGGRTDGHSAPEIARMAGTTKPTVYKWIARYERHGVAGLSDRVSTGRPPEVSTEVRARILALTRQSPPEKTGLSHWSSREMARHLKQEMGVSVSHNFVSTLWREHDPMPLSLF
ncbi:MAG: helix-turn-helix domain-containing protein [Pseudonocardiaceae bacterium]